ncbi:glycerophosphodiester phosphodiesterase [Shewanella chilikensis]|uniref:glycerophosphodiester phosphodiesterase n=1 Tax=Shewanella chilikensis TaxID=558541 RepID=UPI001F2A50F1|nr:glycerophosphodiester phosphodiesterase [Shewanella chilikensis]MCE9787705.1 glycerophosphodiester phosphodiesterase [Shewanella chilikensis]
MLIFAHRGASGYAPENTLKAMALALELGCEAVELDVHHADGELWVFHDRRLSPKSNGKGLLAQQSSRYLRQLRVEGEPIPTLRQVLELIEGRMTVNIELKGVGCIEPFIQQYPQLLQLGYQPEQLLVSSFNHLWLKQVKQQLPNVPVAPLLEGIALNQAAVVSELKAWSLHLDISFINRELVADAHQRGAKVYVYTVDDADDIRALAALGVDGIFANYPDRAATALAQESQIDYRHWFE